MGKGKSQSTSKIKITNKSANKRMKAGRRHKLNKQSNNQKIVNLPTTKVKQGHHKQNNTHKSTNDVVMMPAEREFEEEDEEFSDDEMADFLQDNSENLSFLSASFKRSLKRTAQDDVADYEKVPRLLSMSNSGDIDTNRIHLLPIKGDRGIVQRSVEKPAEVQNDHEEVNEEGPDKEDKTEEHVPMSLVEVLAKKQDEINAKKLKVAQLSQNIVENPEANISSLKQLLSLCTRDQVTSIRKLAMLSLLEIFKDIIPSYRIRELSDAERAIRVSHDVRKLRAFEESLLNNYQKYLQLLEDTIKDCLKLLKRKMKNGTSKSIEISLKAMKSLAIISTKCLSQLLQDVSHFNFRTNIIAVLVPRIETKGELAEISEICSETIKSTFRKDNIGDISLEIMKVIHKLVKTKSNVNPKVLDTMLSLRINADIIQSAAMKSNKIERLKEKREAIRKMSKKEKKRKKVEDKLTKELQEVEAVESKDKMERTQTEIVKLLFVTYFRVLKAGQNSPLLSPVLKGLSKFSHLISVEFFDDLMASIQQLLQTIDLGTTEKLNCILTALRILSGQGESLTIDPRQFYTELYNILPNINAASDASNIELTKECVQIMLIKRRKQVSLPQVLGFFKRMSTMLLQLNNDAVFDFIMIVRNILQLHKKCDYLLDNEGFGCGVFQQDVSDPEHSNADSTALWEMMLLCQHYHPNMTTYSKHIISGAPSQGNGSLPTKLLQRKRVTDKNTEEDISEYFLESISEDPSSNKNRHSKDNDFYSKEFQINIEKNLKLVDKTFIDFVCKQS